MILLIDNYDSFTYNLVQYFGQLGAKIEVRRNDAITLDEISLLSPSHLVISPGPCTPDDAVASGLRYQAAISILAACRISRGTLDAAGP